jgi:hypothetical protein
LRVSEKIDICFAQANSEEGLIHHAQGDDNPDEELMRFEFIECLIRLSQLRYSEHGKEEEYTAHHGGNSEAMKNHKLDQIREKSSGRARKASNADIYACDIPMHETFEKLMSEFIKPAFQAKSTDGEVAKGLQTKEAQVLFAQSFDVLMVVYKFYACKDDEVLVEAEGAGEEGGDAGAELMGRLMQAARRKQSVEEREAEHAAARLRSTQKAQSHRPTMNLAEFEELIHHSGLCMTEKDRAIVSLARAAKAREDKRKRYAAGDYEETDAGQSEGLSHELTELEVRQAFVCSQDDDEESVTDTSELVFAEFVESVAR